MALLTPPIASQKTLNIAFTLVSIAAVVMLLYFGRLFFITLIISSAFAVILDPLVMTIMRVKISRPMASGTIFIALLGVYLLGVVLYGQVATLSRDLPTYSSRVYELLNKAATKFEEVEQSAVEKIVPQRVREQEQQIQERPQEAAKARRQRAGLPVMPPAPPAIQEVRIHTEPTPAISYVYGYFSQYYAVLLMASFVPFLVYFMLSWRDHFRKSFLQFFKDEHRHAAGKSWESVAEITRAFVLGNFILGVLLGAVSAICFFFLRVPYWPLIGLISGFLSLAPYVGLPLAMLPPVMAALAIPNKFTVILTVGGVAALLHVIALNLVYPKLVGRRVHLNPLSVTVALMFWGSLWGGIGLVLAVPITAAFKSVCDNVPSLQAYGRLMGD